MDGTSAGAEWASFWCILCTASRDWIPAPPRRS